MYKLEGVDHESSMFAFRRGFKVDTIDHNNNIKVRYTKENYEVYYNSGWVIKKIGSTQQLRTHTLTIALDTIDRRISENRLYWK